MNNQLWSDESKLEKDFKAVKESLAKLEQENSDLKRAVEEFLKCIRAIHDLTEVLQLSSVYLKQDSILFPKSIPQAVKEKLTVDGNE